MASPEQDTPEARFRERQRRWRTLVQRIYPRHAEVEPHAALLLGWLFDSAERIPGSPFREYALQTDDGHFVRLNADPRLSKAWSWIALGIEVEGRGFYELWAMRWDMPVSLAADQIWTVIRSGAQA